MAHVTSADFQKNFGTYKRLALNTPVRILVHGKETLVLMSMEHYRRMEAGYRAPPLEKPSAAAEPPAAAAMPAPEGRDPSPAIGTATSPHPEAPALPGEKMARIRKMLATSGVAFQERPEGIEEAFRNPEDDAD